MSANLTPAALARYVATWQGLGADTLDLRLVYSLRNSRPGLRRTWTLDKLLHPSHLAWLRRQNAQGYHVYARPVGYRYVLVDDVNRHRLTQAVEFHPCMLIETSPANYQLWYALPNEPASRQEASVVARWLAARLDADPGSAEPDHVGRLPGFTNRKPAYQQGSQWPFVRLHRATVRYASLPPEAWQTVEAQPAPAKPANRPPKAKGGQVDRSAADFALCCDLLERGWDADRVASELLKRSSKAQERGDEYIRRTVAAARQRTHR